MCNNSNCGCNNDFNRGFNNDICDNRFCGNRNESCCMSCGQIKCNCCGNRGNRSCDWNKHCFKKQVDFTDVFDAIKAIREALKDICNGIHVITKCCDVCRGVKLIKEGLCCLEEALEDLCCALQDTDFSSDSCAKRIIEQAICDIKEAIRCICEGLKCIECGNICDGVKMICAAVACVEEGLCDLIRGVKKFSC